MADNFTFLDASAATKTARAVDNSSVWLPATVLAASDGTVVAADDAAAAGPIFPAAGVYQATVDLIDAGDVGRVRMSERRGLINASDWAQFHGYDSAVSDDTGDILVLRNASHAGGAYATPTTAFYDSDDAGFDATAMWHRIPMKNWKSASVFIYNSLGVNITVAVKIVGFTLAAPAPTVFSVAAIANGTEIGLAAAAGGTGASSAWYSIPALAVPALYYYVGVTPASDPGAAAHYRVGIVRQS